MNERIRIVKRDHYDKEYFTTYDDDFPKYLDYLKTGQLYGSKKVCFELSRPHNDMDILEIGIGKGELLASLIKDGADVWGIEYSNDIIETIKYTLTNILPGFKFSELHNKLIVGNALDETIYPKVKFDRVILCATLEHFHHWEIDKLTEIFVNIIKPRGLLIIGNASNPTTFHFKGYRWYGDHCTRISDRFFNVLKQRLNGFFSLEYKKEGYVVFKKNHKQDKFVPDVSIENHYGTGEYSGLPNIKEKVRYFAYKRVYLLQKKHKRVYSFLKKLKQLFIRGRL